MNTKVNEIASRVFTYVLTIIALAILTTSLIFWLVLAKDLAKLEIILITLLLLSSVLGLILLFYVIVNQVHVKTQVLHENFVNQKNTSMFRLNLLKEWEKKNDELEAENDSLRQKLAVRDLLSRIDKTKDTPEKEKVGEPNTTAFNEDIFGAPDENQENK